MLKSQPILKAPREKTASIPILRSGDHLDSEEFERRYNAMPDVKKAELIEGVVYMPSPVRQRHHSRPQFDLAAWLGQYAGATPGLEGGDNATLRLDTKNQPQADLLLMIQPEYGGQAKLVDDYIVGAPDLLVEVSASTVSMDMKTKLEVYRRSKVREYLVWRVEDEEIDWFVLRRGRFVKLAPKEGILRSETFPGLWLDPIALAGLNLARVLEVGRLGVACPEHAAFVACLQASPKVP
jgi:Uma2 family endonuclease